LNFFNKKVLEKGRRGEGAIFFYLKKIPWTFWGKIDLEEDKKIRDTVAGGSVLAFGAQPTAMSRIFF
jgi:hypothetical protein